MAERVILRFVQAPADFAKMVKMMFNLAYLDPGTGSFFLQLLVGGTFGGLLVLKRLWRRVRNSAIGIVPRGMDGLYDETKTIPIESVSQGAAPEQDDS